jgi:hypothetical protein
LYGFPRAGRSVLSVGVKGLSAFYLVV